MAIEVPSKSGFTDSAKTGGMNGLASGIGRTVGRGILGPGVGTALGGITAAAMLSGADRDMVATLAVDHAIDELVGAAGGSSSGTNQQVM